MDRVSFGARCRNARRQIGQIPDRSRGLADSAQLPYGTRIASEHIGSWTAAAAKHPDLGGRLSVYRESDSLAQRSKHHPRQASPVCAPRPAPLPRSAGLVKGIHLDIRVATGRGQHGSDDVNRAMNFHAARGLRIVTLACPNRDMGESRMAFVVTVALRAPSLVYYSAVRGVHGAIA